MTSTTLPSYAALRDLLNEHFTDLGHAASHWSQLYEGGSKLVILIDEQEQVDKIDSLGLQGEFKSVKMRAGAAHWEEGGYLTSPRHATLDVLKEEFYNQHTSYEGNNWFFSTEQEFNEHFSDDEQIRQEIEEAVAEGRFEDAQELKATLGEVKANGNIFRGEGMYDQYGNAILNKGDTCYSEDVWTYAIGFVVDQDAMIDEDSEEKEFRIFGEGRSSGVSVSNDDVRKGRI